jgi:dTDP-4-amino-4,6-dideoxygalactose transaminase
MTETFLPFAKPSLDREAINEVVACLESSWLTTGPRVKRFEDDLKSYLNSPYTLALSSATAGLHLALCTLNLKPGDEVITSPMTFVATLNAIVLAGGKPVLADIEPTTFNIDVKKIEMAITQRTRAILPIHFFGLPVDLDPLYEIAKHYNLRVIEDAAHAIGTSYKNNLIGSFGDTQVFSFHPNKNMTTGEGGCVTTRDPKLAKEISILRFHGIDRDAFDRYSKKGSQNYDVVAPGFKYNMMDMQAAIGIYQLQKLETFITRRTLLANRYRNILNSWPQFTLQSGPHYEHRHAWHQFGVLINSEKAGIDRDTFMQQMKEHNIGTAWQFKAAHLYSFYQQKLGFKMGDFPIAEDVSKRIVSLPLFYDMTEQDQDRVIETMENILTKVTPRDGAKAPLSLRA